MVLIYLCVLFLHGVRSEVDVKENGMMQQNVYVDVPNDHVNAMESHSRQIQMDLPKGNMHERGWGRTKYTVDPLYFSYLKSLNDSSIIRNCKTGGFSCVKFQVEIEDDLYSLGQINLNSIGTFSTKPAYDQTLSTYNGATRHLSAESQKLSAYILKFSDPEWSKQWYMQDYRTDNIPVMDHNIVPVFNMEITGKGVTIAIVGEGIKEHPDLGDSYDQKISYNFCTNKPGALPYSVTYVNGVNYNKEGNSNAGVIAMQSGNNICGVGIAPGAKIAGYRVSNCARTQDELKRLVDRALAYQLDETDIYCNIWMVYDWLIDFRYTGLIVPSQHASLVLKRGATEGRRNKGSIYIFSSGENRAKNNCACNGYLNNPYVITIASANQNGVPASYSERCTAVMATAYSGDVNLEGVVTIDPYGKCSYDFKSTSASPAIASGIIALVLDANPSLTYRDVVHIIAMTAEVAPLANNADTWYRNGRGFWVSNDFGFGLLNAENMVLLAKKWTTVPRQNSCIIRNKLTQPLLFDHTHSVEVVLDGKICNGANTDITYLEHVVLELTGDYYYRGAIYLNLTSPAGTTSSILESRTVDFSQKGFKAWNVMSVHNWGENPKGIWKVTINALEVYHVVNPNGQIDEIAVHLYGTKTTPGNYPRKYAAFRLPNGKTNQFL